MSASLLEAPNTTESPILDPLNFSSSDGEISAKEDGNVVVYQFRNKTFRLDKTKARERVAGKRVINGHRSAELNVLPLKYHEAYRIYKQMKANHWEPDVIDMSKDALQ
jgi:ribonucleoside-diphosphate reductase beta chain